MPFMKEDGYRRGSDEKKVEESDVSDKKKSAVYFLPTTMLAHNLGRIPSKARIGRVPLRMFKPKSADSP